MDAGEGLAIAPMGLRMPGGWGDRPDVVVVAGGMGRSPRCGCGCRGGFGDGCCIIR